MKLARTTQAIERIKKTLTKEGVTPLRVATTIYDEKIGTVRSYADFGF